MSAENFEDFHLVHPVHYADRGYPHPLWTRLRREDPVHWFDRTDGPTDDQPLRGIRILDCSQLIAGPHEVPERGALHRSGAVSLVRRRGRGRRVGVAARVRGHAAVDLG